jgi:N-hydroxyarylamine O-acetyltransferase
VNVNAYLERINYHGPLELTAETLRGLQVAHLLTVPFENLSIHTGQPIVLKDEALFKKIVERRRGGFCYECNGLFAALLRAIGFDVSVLSAEVASAEGDFSPPFDHMALMVRLEHRWLVDVGFGESFLEPLVLDERGDQRQGNHAYRIVPDDSYLNLLSNDGAAWKPEYRFTLQPYTYRDFNPMCRYHQTSPDSHFTQRRICSRAIENGGRITVSEMRLISTSSDGARQERALQGDEEYRTVLREEFGITMTG